ncbi:DUF3871 family protein [Chryseobacterium angstadtii]|nr:DUF3871 family protein [Chryseobacterium angstadtii]
MDVFLKRKLNAFEFSKGIRRALNGNSDYHWFLVENAARIEI